jgi:DNA repair exonuclease SbcCD ATPase subunit
MKLQKVEIKNFLVLPDVEVNFEQSKITFLNGLNGRGKTTFQKALRWCLYGPGFEDGHRVLSDLTFSSSESKNSRAEVKVRMTFALENAEYATITIERSQWFQASTDSSGAPLSEPELRIFGKSSEPGSPTVPLPDPDSWMND